MFTITPRIETSGASALRPPSKRQRTGRCQDALGPIGETLMTTPRRIYRPDRRAQRGQIDGCWNRKWWRESVDL